MVVIWTSNGTFVMKLRLFNVLLWPFEMWAMIVGFRMVGPSPRLTPWDVLFVFFRWFWGGENLRKSRNNYPFYSPCSMISFGGAAAGRLTVERNARAWSWPLSWTVFRMLTEVSVDWICTISLKHKKKRMLAMKN